MTKKSERFRYEKNNALFSRKGNIMSLLAALLMFGALAAMDALNVIDLPLFKDSAPATAVNTGSKINYDPPTEDEKKETEIFKDNLVDSDNQNPTPSPNSNGSQKKSITPVITSWGQNPTTNDVEVAGFMDEVIESGGTCTLTLQKGPETVVASSQATTNAQNVSCGYITIPRNQLTTGQWSAKISYSSPSYEGSSRQDIKIEVK